MYVYACMHCSSSSGLMTFCCRHWFLPALSSRCALAATRRCCTATAPAAPAATACSHLHLPLYPPACTRRRTCLRTRLHSHHFHCAALHPIPRLAAGLLKVRLCEGMDCRRKAAVSERSIVACSRYFSLYLGRTGNRISLIRRVKRLFCSLMHFVSTSPPEMPTANHSSSSPTQTEPQYQCDVGCLMKTAARSMASSASCLL